ncbi:MAG TPA: 4-oxalocrotonate tautomerase family protein [Syntrophomonadaceae bacterium]|nr:4-oxalocrotonate tautomerase family protein [Syntrophomonadaceae bacterium]
MPFVTVKMLKSKERDVHVKRKLVEGITGVVASTLNVKPEAVWVNIEEVERENWAEGGKLSVD